MTVTRLAGDSRDVLLTLPDQHFHCCVTSPPYFGLRNYSGGDTREIGTEQTLDCMAWARNERPCGECYICALLSVFGSKTSNDGVWRVLRGDGVFWLNIADSYAAKNLCMAPARLALALQAAGWYVRSDIIWQKPNAMPGSQEDRCTSSHEYVWMLTKSQRYYFDNVAIMEVATGETKGAAASFKRAASKRGVTVCPNSPMPTHRADRPDVAYDGGMRTKRDVWTIATKPESSAHYAVMPAALVEPCVLSSTSERGCCSECGSPWKRITRPVREHGLAETSFPKTDNLDDHNGHKRLHMRLKAARAAGEAHDHALGGKETLGWEASCGCDLSGENFLPDDFEMVATPTGTRTGDDPTLNTGRAGMNRPRGDAEGSRPITRYEQRQYAALLKASPHKSDMADEAGEAFAHYVRTDSSGARPIPDRLLSDWIERGWVASVSVPVRRPYAPVACRVLDPFAGAGTVLMVAAEYRRDATGIDLVPENIEITNKRLARVQPRLALETP